jgi:hypothetical protein
MCSKKLKAALPLWLTFYSDIDEAKRRLISKISESTIYRILKSYRSRPKGKGISMQLCGIRGRPKNEDERKSQPSFSVYNSTASGVAPLRTFKRGVY